jgi:hypothetical protein
VAASQLNITPNTPMGASLIAGGATFRTWAPHASEVYIAIGYPAGTAAAAFPKNANDLLVKDPAADGRGGPDTRWDSSAAVSLARAATDDTCSAKIFSQLAAFRSRF